MPNVYSYRARDMSGKVVRGQIQADDMNRAAELIRSRRMVILELAPGRTRKKEFPLFKKKTIPLKEFAVFCRQMSTMTNAGVTIMSSISAIAAQAENPLLAEVLTDVGKELESGKTFSEACAKHKDFFPNIFISMVEAGEASGALDDVLGRMAEYFENQSEIREKVKSATTYPTFIGVAAVAVVIVLMTTVIPGFASMFAEGGQDLPGITVAMMAASNFMQNSLHHRPRINCRRHRFQTVVGNHQGRHTSSAFPSACPNLAPSSELGHRQVCRSLSILVASGCP